MQIIRKISVGNNYPNEAIHYQVGKKLKLGLKEYIITNIVLDRDLANLGKISYDIYVANETEKILWKSVMNLPVVLEYNIDFE